MKYTAVVLALFASTSHATSIGTVEHWHEGATVGAHIATKHFTGTWNDINPGVYVRLRNGATMGVFENSESRTSTYGGYTASYRASPTVEVSITAGIMTGYKAGAMPMVLPSVAFGSDTKMRLAYIPKVHRDGSAGVHLMIERVLK